MPTDGVHSPISNKQKHGAARVEDTERPKRLGYGAWGRRPARRHQHADKQENTSSADGKQAARSADGKQAARDADGKQNTRIQRGRDPLRQTAQRTPAS